MDDLKQAIREGDVNFSEYENVIHSHLKDIICTHEIDLVREDSYYLTYLIAIHPDKFNAKMMLLDFKRVGDKVMGEKWIHVYSLMSYPTMRGAIESENIGILEQCLTFVDERIMLENIQNREHGPFAVGVLQRWFYDKFPEYPYI